MTEDEAKTKWCPFARLVPGDADGQGGLTNVAPVACNRFSMSGNLYAPKASLCIASACMAWRWHKEPVYYSALPGGVSEPVFNPNSPRSTTEGHCGLAGSP